MAKSRPGRGAPVVSAGRRVVAQGRAGGVRLGRDADRHRVHGKQGIGMNVFGRRREEKPVAADATRPGQYSDPGAETPPQPTMVPVTRDPAFGSDRPTPGNQPPDLRSFPGPRPTSRDPASMSLAPKPPTPSPSMPVGPTPPAGTAIPPRPPQMGMQPTPGAPGAPGPRGQAQDRRTLVVGRGISLQGTVSDAERLVVEGTVESQMIQATELSISQSGVFKGEVQVEDAEIAGVFDGTLTARGMLVVRGTGRVVGVARCRRLMVEDGGQVSGKMEMLGDTQVPPGPAPRYAEA